MTELAQALLAIGIVGTFGTVAGLISIKVAEHIVEEAEKMEEEQEDYVYMNDGTPVLYNEEDQE
jgi:hypothetical protein